jgi:hypothetical protein
VLREVYANRNARCFVFLCALAKPRSGWKSPSRLWCDCMSVRKALGGMSNS